MTLRRFAVAGLVLWLIVLAVLLQPQSTHTVRVLHAQRVDRPTRDLPTLPPLVP